MIRGVERCGFNFGGVARTFDLNMVPEAISKKLEPMHNTENLSLIATCSKMLINLKLHTINAHSVKWMSASSINETFAPRTCTLACTTINMHPPHMYFTQMQYCLL